MLAHFFSGGVMRTRVKICGFTRKDDALAAAALGVDAMGLVFYPPSPRNIGVEVAADIVSALPAFVSVVGLFVDAEPDWIRTVQAKVRIDCLQFHGDEAPEQCRMYDRAYIKAIRMQPGTDLARIQSGYGDAAGLLLDAWHPGVQGGTGSRFDWDLIPNDLTLPLILAGGLTADNAEHAVRSVRPYALDVSSGVEVAKGIKSPAKMAEFIRKTNQTL
ncbi:MAG: phosphoribosylanthranilate isomerase [Methylomonas sp.]|nr:MAG: phosphoribosylanthranilate isomerase [Methylomonas sp.]PPD27654.1 MAG: phosphoribosylanthranilate isomerase [Methylomonas sp.]PPD38210.1 MAG: phosphoribosylanthranilate isomerase [Methylomonas sp.]PPD39640.1 MAG: phosphoribosylanthranilate isomerase [Methylomonas sp.]PPD51672.1 MAG: phosphoribosylanthranilate isomerase [Methylomonas sp.]